MHRIRAIKSPSGFSQLEQKWQELVELDPNATPFQTFAWQSAWWRIYGSGKSPLFLAVEDGEALLGLYPLYITNGPWRAVRPMGHGISDYLHPLALPEARQEVNESLSAWLIDGVKADFVDLHQLRRGLELPDFDPNPIEQARCLVLDLPDTFDAYLATLGKSLRYDVKRLSKTRADIVPTTLENLDFALNAFFDLHSLRWKKRGLPGAFVGKRVKAFHWDWAQRALLEDRLWLSTLVVDEKPVGSIYAMRTGKTCFFYQAGFDPLAKALSPGTLLVADTIRRAIEEGLTKFDFLRGDEPYKRRWKPQHEFPNLRQMAARNARGVVGMRVNRAESKVEDKIRARLEGKGLLG